MKITKSQLKQIIKEELEVIAQEGLFSTPEEKEKKKREKNIKKAKGAVSDVEKTLQQFGQFDKLEEEDSLESLESSEVLRRVKDLVDEAFLNKSLGFKPEVGVGYLKKVKEALSGIE